MSNLLHGTEFRLKPLERGCECVFRIRCNALGVNSSVDERRIYRDMF